MGAFEAKEQADSDKERNRLNMRNRMKRKQFEIKGK